jgi:hypothetical protein
MMSAGMLCAIKLLTLGVTKRGVSDNQIQQLILPLLSDPS